MTGKIEKLVAGGDGLCRYEGRVVFIPLTLPGEEVRFEIVREKKDFAWGTLIEVLVPSRWRVKPLCPYYGSCGGCNLMHATIDEQRNIKKNIFTECLERNGISFPANIPVLGGNPWHYRRRAQIHFTQNGEAAFSRRESNELIAIDSCEVLAREFLPLLKNPQLLASKKSHTVQGRQKGNNKINCFAWSGQLSTEDVVVRLLDNPISFHARGFFQSNIEVLEQLLQRIRSTVNGDCLYDLYGGVAIFSSLLEDNFEKIFSVESFGPSKKYAVQNTHSQKTRIISSSVEKFLYSTKVEQADVILVDPPRGGLSKNVRKALLQQQFRELVYVSCDPTTFARDASFFLKNQCSLDILEIYDFYPQTSHIESLAVFRRDQ